MLSVVRYTNRVGWVVFLFFVLVVGIAHYLFARPLGETQPSNPQPTWFVTFYQNGQIIDVIEATSFETKQASTVQFRTYGGAADEVVIINDCIVAKRYSSNDYSKLEAARKTTAHMQKLFSLKRQEFVLKKEIAKQTQINEDYQQFLKEISDEIVELQGDTGD